MLFVIHSKERRKAAADFVASLRASPVMQVEVKEYKNNRSLSQNRLMWMWYKPIADHVGEEVDDLHEICKVRFLGTEQKMIEGQCIIQPRSTTTLTTAEMTDYLHKVEALATEMQIVLPIPDDYNTAMGIK